MTDNSVPLPPDAKPAGESKPPEDQEPESDVWTGSPCFRAGFGRLIIAAAATIIIVLIVLITGWRWLRASYWAILLLLWAWALLSAAWPKWSNAFRLTTQRMFIRRGLLRQVTDQTELIRVDDVRVRQNIVQRHFGVGDVLIVSTDPSDPLLELGRVADPHSVAELVRKHTRCCRKQSYYVEQL